MQQQALHQSWITLIVLLLSTSSLSAQCLESEGKLYSLDGTSCTNNLITAVPFLRIVADARSSALGDVGVAISADANAIDFNASKLAFAEADLAMAANYTSWLPRLGVSGVYLASLNGYKRIGKKQTLGFGFRYFTLGDLPLVNVMGMALNTPPTREFSGSIAYARTIAKRLSVGITGKLIYSNLVAGLVGPGGSIQSSDVAGAADISFTYATPLQVIPWRSDLRLGLVFSNLGSKMNYTADGIDRDYLPANLGLGAAWEIQFDEYNSLTVATDLNKLMVPTPCPSTTSAACDLNGNGRPDFKEQSPLAGVFDSFSDAPAGFKEELRELVYAFGLEYWYKRRLAIRSGYYHEHSTKGSRQYFTTGLGFSNSLLGLNFSYLLPTTNQRNPIDNTWRLSLLVHLEQKEARL